MADVEQIRRAALGLPGVQASDHFGAASFRTRQAIFAVMREPGLLTLKLHPEDQRNLLQLHGESMTPVSGGKRNDRAGREGWTHVRYADVDGAALAGLLKLAWSGVAPKRVQP